MKIYIYRDNEVRGPFSRIELLAELRAGGLRTEDLACFEAEETWQPLGQLLRDEVPIVAVPEVLHGAKASISSPVSLSDTPLACSVPVDGDEPFRPKDNGKHWTIPVLLMSLFCVCAIVSYALNRHLFLSTPRIIAQRITIAHNSQKEPDTQKNYDKSIVSSLPMHETHSTWQNTEIDQSVSLSPAAPSQAEQSLISKDLPADGSSLRDPASPTGTSSTANSAQPTNVAVPVTATDKRRSAPEVGGSTTKSFFQTPTITPEELSRVLEQRIATIPVNSTLEPIVKAAPNITIREGTFILDTTLKGNPRVEIVYSIPLINNAISGPRASDVFMLGIGLHPPVSTTIDGPEKIAATKLLQSRVTPFSQKFGFTAFTMHIVAWASGDPGEPYLFPGPEWAEVVFRAQDELTRKFHLVPKKLMMEGMSTGAMLVEKTAAAAPNRVAAVVVHSAPKVDMPTQHSDTLWYLQITRGDNMQQEYDDLYNTLVRLNDNVLIDVTPPDYGMRGAVNIRGEINLYHTESALAKEAAHALLEGVANTRDSTGHSDPLTWPYVRCKTSPLIILSRNSPDFAKIPIQSREFLPSERFVRCLQSLPVRVQSMILPTLDGGTTKCFVGLPPLGRVRGILIYSPERQYSAIANLFDSVYYLAERGYVVLCLYSTNAMAQAALTATLNFAHSIGVSRETPVVVVGAGDTGSSLWESISRSAVDPKAIAMIDFKPQQAFDESKLPVGARPIRCPVFFVEEEKRMLAASTSAQARETLNDAQKIDNYVTMCRERHQTARIVSIPDSDRLDSYDAQKTIEAVNNAFADVVDGKKGFIK